MYPHLTALALQEAADKPAADRTVTDRLLLYMNEQDVAGRWSDARELTLNVSHKFSSRLSELSATGIKYLKRRQENAPKGKVYYEYKLATEEDLKNENAA